MAIPADAAPAVRSPASLLRHRSFVLFWCARTATTGAYQMLAVAVARPGAVMLAPAPSFVMYESYARLCGMRYVSVALNADFSLDADAMLAAIEREEKAASEYSRALEACCSTVP